MELDLTLWNQQKKALKLTFDSLAEITGISRRQLVSIFHGDTTNPGIAYVQKIEQALGLDNPPPTDELSLSEEERHLAEMIAGMTDEEVEELSRFVDYIISKRS
jgi:transcriptional regulator with XRE-family HTH domain